MRLFSVIWSNGRSPFLPLVKGAGGIIETSHLELQTVLLSPGFYLLEVGKAGECIFVVIELKADLLDENILLDKISKMQYNILERLKVKVEVIKMMDLGQFLRSIREAKKLTLRFVEAKTGVSNAYLSQIENGKISKPSPIMLYKLSQFYKISYDDLMSKAGFPTSESIQENNLESGSGSLRNVGRTSILATLDDVTPEEEEELLEFLAFMRSRREKR